MKKPTKTIKYLSNCCKCGVKQTCEIERPKGGSPGVTLVIICNNCNKECWLVKENL